MVYQGTVKDGVAEENSSLAEGTTVQAEPVTGETHISPLAQRLLKFAGTIKGLPSDFARNHDHYIHGRPRKP
jgi:hypothetical protein